ncbi:hypothetical protein HDV05_002985, partial [Chytridiales sp. JEL 0842]
MSDLPSNVTQSGIPEIDQVIASSGLSEAQLNVLKAISDTFFPSIDEETSHKIAAAYAESIQRVGGADPPSQEELIKFMTASASHVRTSDDMVRILSHHVPEDVAFQINAILYLLTTGWGTTLLLGTRTGVPFVDLTFKEREDGLLAMANSSLNVIRMLFKSLKGVTVLPSFGKNLHVAGYKSAQEPNPLWKALEYPGFPDEKEIPPADSVWRPVFEDMAALAEAAGKGNPIVLETDVVVVGSGAGGGIVAAELAAAGHRVIVVEKAKYVHHTDQNYNELESFSTFYERNGALQAEDGSMQLLAGTAWGGGTYVN